MNVPALQGGDCRCGLRVAGGIDDLAVDHPHDVDATDRVVGAGAPDVPSADERPLVAGVDVLDLEVAGGVVDERLPRAERRVIALIAGAVGSWLDALHDAVGRDDVLEEGGVPLLERPVEAVDDLVGCRRHDCVPVMVRGWGLTWSRLVDTASPKAVKVSRRSVGRDHRSALIGCGRSAIGRRDMTWGPWPWPRSRSTIPPGNGVG